MFDFKFDWDKTIEIGIDEIDTQHKELFRVGRDIEQLILTNAAGFTEERILDLLCELRNYTTYHFYTEEQIMRRQNAPELEAHRAQHEGFVKYINGINCIQLVAEPVEEFMKIKDYIQTWFFNHILVEDKKIKNA